MIKEKKPKTMTTGNPLLTIKYMREPLTDTQLTTNIMNKKKKIHDETH